MVSLIPVNPVVPVPSVQGNAALIGKFRQQGPRDTSSRTADRFTDALRYRDDLQVVAALRPRGGRKPLSLHEARAR
jgi:oxygen-independent coproporphyrinogen-3 oxidase